MWPFRRRRDRPTAGPSPDPIASRRPNAADGARGHRAVGAAAAVTLVPVWSAEPHADDRALDRDRRLLADLLAGATGRPVDPVATAVAVGAIFSPPEAVGFGLADAVVPDP